MFAVKICVNSESGVINIFCKKMFENVFRFLALTLFSMGNNTHFFEIDPKTDSFISIITRRANIN